MTKLNTTNVEIFDFYTNEIIGQYDSISSAAKKMNVSQSNLSQIISENHANHTFKQKNSGKILSVRKMDQTLDKRVQWRLNYFFKEYHESLKPSTCIYEDEKRIMFSKHSKVRDLVGKTKSISFIKRNNSRIDVLNEVIEYKLRWLYTWRIQNIFLIKKRFGDPGQNVIPIQRVRKMNITVWKVDPNTLVRLERHSIKELRKSIVNNYIRLDTKVPSLVPMDGFIWIEAKDNDEDLVGEKINIDVYGVCCSTEGCENPIVQPFHIKRCRHCQMDNSKLSCDLTSILGNMISNGRKDAKTRNKLYTLTLDNILKDYNQRNGCCYWCNEKVDVSRNVAHKDAFVKLNSISVDSLTPGGGHLEGKCVISCRFCNLGKGTANENTFRAVLHMLQNNYIDFNTIIPNNPIYRCFNHVLRSKYHLDRESVFQEMKKNKFKGRLGIPYFPTPQHELLEGSSVKETCPFLPSPDRSENDNKEHRGNIVMEPLFMNMARNDLDFESFEDAFKRKFPKFDKDKLVIKYPNDWNWDDWKSNIQNNKIRAKNVQKGMLKRSGAQERYTEIIKDFKERGHEFDKAKWKPIPKWSIDIERLIMSNKKGTITNEGQYVLNVIDGLKTKFYEHPHKTPHEGICYRRDRGKWYTNTKSIKGSRTKSLGTYTHLDDAIKAKLNEMK